jgi:hypothetical protein
MKRFKSFIAEEINPAAAFDRARSISIYLKGRAKERFDEAIDLFVEASNTMQSLPMHIHMACLEVLKPRGQLAERLIGRQSPPF